MLGMNYTVNNDYKLQGTGRNAATDYIPTLDPSKEDDQRTTSSLYEERLLGYFTRMTYDYNVVIYYPLLYDMMVHHNSRKIINMLYSLLYQWVGICIMKDWFPKNFVNRLKLRG